MSDPFVRDTRGDRLYDWLQHCEASEKIREFGDRSISGRAELTFKGVDAFYGEGRQGGKRRPRSKWDENLFDAELITARAFISHLSPLLPFFRLEGVFDSRTKAWKNRAITVARWIRPARYVSRASVRDTRVIGSGRCAAVASFRPIFLRCVTKSRFFLSSFFFFLPSVDKLHWQIYQWSKGNLRAPIKRDSASRR